MVYFVPKQSAPILCVCVCVCFKNSFILRRLERGSKPGLTPHDRRHHFSLSGIQTCVHPQRQSSTLPLRYGCRGYIYFLFLYGIKKWGLIINCCMLPVPWTYYPMRRSSWPPAHLCISSCCHCSCPEQVGCVFLIDIARNQPAISEIRDVQIYKVNSK